MAARDKKKFSFIEECSLRRIDLPLSIRLSLVVFCLIPHILVAGTMGGVMSFAKLAKDFGTVYQGQKLDHSFRFRNSGDGPLRLKGVYSACGCAVAAFEKDRIFAPGEEGEIKLTFDTSQFSGQVRKAIAVMTDEKGIPERLLTVSANILEEYQVIPPVVDFGDISTAQGGRQKVYIRPIGGFDLTVRGVEYDAKLFDVRISQEGTSWAVEIDLKLNQEAGFFRQDIHILTSSNKLPKFRLPIRAMIKGNIAYSPEYLEFGAINRDESAKRMIQVDLKGKYQIVQASSQLHLNGNQLKNDAPYLKVEVPQNGGNDGHVMVLLSNKSQFAGSVHGSIQLATDDPLQKEIKVDFYAYFR